MTPGYEIVGVDAAGLVEIRAEEPDQAAAFKAAANLISLREIIDIEVRFHGRPVGRFDRDPRGRWEGLWPDRGFVLGKEGRGHLRRILSGAVAALRAGDFERLGAALAELVEARDLVRRTGVGWSAVAWELDQIRRIHSSLRAAGDAGDLDTLRAMLDELSVLVSSSKFKTAA